MTSRQFRLFLSALCLAPVAVFAGEASGGVGVVPFIGRFHILALHLPIGLLLGAFVVEVYVMVKPNDAMDVGKLPFVLLGALSAWAAVFLGLMLEESGDYTGDLIFQHKWSGIAVAVVATLAFFLKRKFLKTGEQKTRKAYRASLFICVGLLGFAGHVGGSITHGRSFLDPSVLFAKPVEVSETAGDFERLIWPILDRECVECHGPDKQKSKFRLDTKAFILAGGSEHDDVIVPGDPEESAFYWMLGLPEDDDLVMPPKAPFLPKEEQEIIRKWIADGADFGTWEKGVITPK